LTFVNTQGSIKVLKEDADGEALAGATFKITQEDGDYEDEVADADNDGVILFTDVPLGTYTVSETVVPAGYAGAADQTGVVSENMLTVELTFVNSQVAGEVVTPVQPEVKGEVALPATGWNMLPLVLAAGLLMLLGLMALMLGVVRLRRS